MAIEAAQLAIQGMVYAIEPEPADIALIQANAEAFGVPNVPAVLGRAPEVLASLPEPDAIFVGGTGRQVDLVLSAAYRPAVPGGQHGGERRDDRGAGGGLPHPQGAGRRGARLERLDRARDRADGPAPVRVDRPDVPAGGHQAGAGSDD